jgi:hypothetical protein
MSATKQNTHRKHIIPIHVRQRVVRTIDTQFIENTTSTVVRHTILDAVLSRFLRWWWFGTRSHVVNEFIFFLNRTTRCVRFVLTLIALAVKPKRWYRLHTTILTVLFVRWQK